MAQITETEIREYLNTHDKGVLSKGSHQKGDGAYCALECIGQLRGAEEWTDSPALAGMPDIRPINDGPWKSDEERTAAMIPMLSALSVWSEWPERQRRVYATEIAIQTVRQLVSSLPSLPDAIREKCKVVSNLEMAAAAAKAAASAANAAHAAANAASAANAAYTAAHAAANAAAAAKAAANAANATYTAAHAAANAASAANAAYTAAHAAANAAAAAKAAHAANATYADDASNTVLVRACKMWTDAVTIVK